MVWQRMFAESTVDGAAAIQLSPMARHRCQKAASCCKEQQVNADGHAAPKTVGMPAAAACQQSGGRPVGPLSGSTLLA